jgi:beta-lactamase regulating signal transducer with metallopeptidase domain
VTPFVSALLIKLTLILSLGLLISAALRSLSPSFRHLVLYATLASCAALPFVMWMSPRWDVPVLPRSSSTTLPGANGQESSLTAKAIDLGAARLPSRDGGAMGSASVPRIADVPAAQSAGLRERLAAIRFLPLAWMLGFAAVIAWLAVGRIGLRRIARSAWPLDTSDWKEILDEEREYAGVTKPVTLCSSSVVSTPLTWGSLAPVILLPEDALDWPESHRRIVLRHELAHIARGDSFTQLTAGFVCALYWFHPLVWMSERRLRAECERACDDNVVSLGTPAAEYAAHLLEVARSARAFGAPGFLSVAMARPSQLEGRLLAVLNESRRRVSLSRGARPAAALLAALVLIPLAAFRPVSKSDAPAKDGVAFVEPNAVAASAISIPPAAKTSSPGVIQSAGLTALSSAAPTSPTLNAATSSWSAVFSTEETSEKKQVESVAAADTTFHLYASARSAGTLTLDLKTGGAVIITGWDRPEVAVGAALAGRSWSETVVKITPSGGDVRLESDFTRGGNNHSTSHVFRISVPRSYNVRISSSGGAVSITGVDGTFTGSTGGGEIEIKKASGEVDIRTGGGDIHVSDSKLNGTVRTGGGIVQLEGITGNLEGKSGSGPVIYTKMSGRTSISRKNGVTYVQADSGELGVHSGSGSGTGSGVGTASSGGVRTSVYSKNGNSTSTTTYINDGDGRIGTFGSSGIRMNSAGGAISLRAAPDGARVTTGGGAIRIGPSGGEVYAHTGGGNIDIGPATGSVEAHTGAGEVTIELKGAGEHSVDVTSGLGQVTLMLPRDLNATLQLETAFTENFGKKTRIVSDFPLQTTETPNWDRREGTARRYVRANQSVGRGGPVIRVRTVNGDIVIKRS